MQKNNKYVLNVTFVDNYHLSATFDTYLEAKAHAEGILQNGEVEVLWYDINEVEVQL